ncbi:MAG: glycosyltransferase [Oscillospiraceae bacterium]|nr:glycosyltransferase [Oscillospiraceae bacterium]
MGGYSVLMSVYPGEKPAYFEQSLESMIKQTVVTDDFVVVCDGPLTPELDAVLERYQQQYPGIFHIVRMESNMGIGSAANVGLQHCKNDLVAKMDTDDIAVPTRCEAQLKRFAECPELTVLGGYIEEFDEDPACPTSVRSVPLSNENIRKFARRRQPFNNMTVMYRREAVMQVGAYRNLRRAEDFDLYIRLLHAGYYCENMDQVLVRARVNSAAFARRGSVATLKGCVQSRWNSYKLGYASFLDVCVCVCGGIVMLLSNPAICKFIYKLFLRDKP